MNPVSCLPRIYASLLDGIDDLDVRLEPTEEVPLPLRKIREVEVDPDITISAVDGGHKGMELEGYFFGLALAIGYTGNLHLVLDPDPIWRGRPFRLVAEYGSAWMSLVEQMLVFEVALEVAKERKPDYLMIDGSLMILPGLLFLREDGEDVDRKVKYEDDKISCVRAGVQLLNYCYEERIKVFGVVKRPRGKLINKRQRDGSILDRRMSVGDLYGPISPGMHPCLAFYSACLEGGPMDIKSPSSSDFFQIAYLKTSSLRGPMRLEVPYWVDVEEIASLTLSASDPASGIPAHILKADSLARISDEVLRVAYLKLVRRDLSVNGHPNSELRPMRGKSLWSWKK